MLILSSAWKLVKRSAHILLEGAPEWLDVADIQAKIISTVPDVSGIHHVHVWCQTPQNLMLTMHVVLDESVADVTAVVRTVKRILQAEFGINHSTIEVEKGDCADH
jgi:cobalt-zinc-cadmium efflux system protein